MTAPGSAQSPPGAQPPSGAQPPPGAPPPPGAQPPPGAEPPPGVQQTGNAQGPGHTQLAGRAQGAASAQPAADARVPAGTQPAATAQPAVSARPPTIARESMQGRYAGFASRFVAFAVDMGASVGVFLLGLAAANFAATVVTAHQVSWSRTNVVVLILLVAWEFVYFAYSWGASGKTLGMAVLGIRVVRRDGGEMDHPRGIGRTLAFPLSFLFLGLGFLGILFGNDRRALHDVIAGTAVVYAWNARAARLRFLARESGHHRPPRGARPS